MPDRRVVFISEISAGSKFRLVGDRIAGIQKAKTQGTRWASCAINATNGNFQYALAPVDPANPSQRSHFKLVMLAGFETFIKVYPPKWSVFNLPCPARYNYSFAQRSGPGNTPGHGFSLFGLKKGK
jgi:hypothetical protein